MAGYEERSPKAEESYKAQIEFMDGPCLEVSSSIIRERLAQNKTIRYLVPDNVVKYIMKHKLYRGNYRCLIDTGSWKR